MLYNTRAAAVNVAARYAILSEMNATDCEIVSLLAGAYGSREYVEHEYGFTITRQDRACGEATLAEMITFVKEETGADVTSQDILAVMMWAHDRYQTAQERAADRMRDGIVSPVPA
jgi:hypothetical protein